MGTGEAADDYSGRSTAVQVCLKLWNKRALLTDTMTRIDTHYTDAARNT